VSIEAGERGLLVLSSLAGSAFLPGGIAMIGVIETLKRGFGFITEEGTQRLWYFGFSDLTQHEEMLQRFQRIQLGDRVQFEKKGDHPQAPAAHKIEILT
jgi:cold shock CspA family protein